MKAITLHSDLNILYSYLIEVILWRLANLDVSFDQEAPKIDKTTLSSTLVTAFLLNIDLSRQETVAFLIALSPNIQPSFLLDRVSESFPAGIDLPQFGGVQGNHEEALNLILTIITDKNIFINEWKLLVEQILKALQDSKSKISDDKELEIIRCLHKINDHIRDRASRYQYTNRVK